MNKGHDKEKSLAIQGHVPTCSNNGTCRCPNYVSHVSASNLVNVVVTCKKRGKVNGKVAKICYHDRTARKSTSAEKKTPPST